MKAEQRKELETNTLADKMGQMMKRFQGSPRRTFMIYVAVAALLIVGSYFIYRWVVIGRQDASEQWIKLFDGSNAHLAYLIQKDTASPAGKAARFQAAWYLYWHQGILQLGKNNDQAMKSMKICADQYAQLAEECKDDPIFEPQALLGLAVVEETRSVESRGHLDKAAEYYEAVTKKHEKTEHAKFAQARLDLLKDKEKGERAKLSNLYEDLQKSLGVKGPGERPAIGPDGMPPALKKKDLP
jgi:hypothetical protein